ncbi:hypothetical protein DFS34DRAFT_224184 [Phlyctochytrium arcticum]|nr:hypothetical protein DFS34DRAFT_224184 [Phlyctochytrium arcticum]
MSRENLHIRANVPPRLVCLDKCWTPSSSEMDTGVARRRYTAVAHFASPSQQRHKAKISLPSPGMLCFKSVQSNEGVDQADSKLTRFSHASGFDDLDRSLNNHEGRNEGVKKHSEGLSDDLREGPQSYNVMVGRMEKRSFSGQEQSHVPEWTLPEEQFKNFRRDSLKSGATLTEPLDDDSFTHKAPSEGQTNQPHEIFAEMVSNASQNRANPLIRRRPSLRGDTGTLSSPFSSPASSESGTPVTPRSNRTRAQPASLSPFNPIHFSSSNYTTSDGSESEGGRSTGMDTPPIRHTDGTLSNGLVDLDASAAVMDEKLAEFDVSRALVQELVQAKERADTVVKWILDMWYKSMEDGSAGNTNGYKTGGGSYIPEKPTYASGKEPQISAMMHSTLRVPGMTFEQLYNATKKAASQKAPDNQRSHRFLTHSSSWPPSVFAPQHDMLLSRVEGLATEILETPVTAMIHTNAASNIMHMLQELIEEQRRMVVAYSAVEDLLVRLQFTFAPVSRLAESLNQYARILRTASGLEGLAKTPPLPARNLSRLSSVAKGHFRDGSNPEVSSEIIAAASALANTVNPTLHENTEDNRFSFPERSANIEIPRGGSCAKDGPLSPSDGAASFDLPHFRVQGPQSDSIELPATPNRSASFHLESRIFETERPPLKHALSANELREEQKSTLVRMVRNKDTSTNAISDIGRDKSDKQIKRKPVITFLKSIKQAFTNSGSISAPQSPNESSSRRSATPTTPLSAWSRAQGAVFSATSTTTGGSNSSLELTKNHSTDTLPEASRSLEEPVKIKEHVKANTEERAKERAGSTPPSTSAQSRPAGKDMSLLCRLCEEQVPARTIEDHSKVCAIQQEFHLKSWNCDIKLRKYAAILEAKKELLHVEDFDDWTDWQRLRKVCESVEHKALNCCGYRIWRQEVNSKGGKMHYASEKIFGARSQVYGC